MQKKSSNRLLYKPSALKYDFDGTSFNFENLKYEEYSSIVYKSKEDLDFSKYGVLKAKTKCGVEDFYPNSNPDLPDIKIMQDKINEFIQELAKENTDMKDKPNLPLISKIII